MEFISVICPIYNEEKYIEKCIQSVVDSDFPKEEMELLLIDGGSSDRTIQIIDRYCEKYSWSHVMENPRGPSQTHVFHVSVYSLAENSFFAVSDER